MFDEDVEVELRSSMDVVVAFKCVVDCREVSVSLVVVVVVVVVVIISVSLRSLPSRLKLKVRAPIFVGDSSPAP